MRRNAVLPLLLMAVPAFAAGLQPSAAVRRAPSASRWVERTLRSMTIEEKIGQMLMGISPVGAFRSADSEELKDLRRAITEFHLGGVHAGIGDAAAIAVQHNEFQRLAKIPLFISSNFEGGAGYVLYGSTRIPRGMAIAATGDEQLAYEAARVAAVEGRALGVNVNFHPVVDVNNNPANPIINLRSFGEDPETVARYTAAYVRGAQDHGQLATAKHFPGHGDVSIDSHLAMPVIDVGRDRLDRVELPPFRSAIAAGVGAIMSAHIWLPQIDQEKDLPATLSRNILTGLLRDEMRFDGVIVSDAMSMKGITSTYSNDDAAVRAVEAGVDLLINSPSIETSFNAIKAAVASGRITESRIDASVRRILTAKANMGLNRRGATHVNLDEMMARVGTRENLAVAQRIADEAITLVRDEQGVLPLETNPDLRVVQINVLDTRDGWREGAVGRIMRDELPKRFPRAVTVQVDDQTSRTEYDLVRKLAQLADVLVVNGFIRVTSSKGRIDLGDQQTALVRELAAMKKPFVFTAFGNPFILSQVPSLPSYAVTYEISGTAEHAAVKAISGEIPYKGRLPVSFPGLYPIGHGLSPRLQVK